MNRNQRRIHAFSWLFLSLVLSLAIVLVVSRLTTEWLPERKALTLPVNNDSFIYSADGSLAVSFSDVSGGTLSVRLLEPLKYASLSIYTMDRSGQRGPVLGQLEGTGDYEFKFAGPLDGILIVDELKDKEIYKIEF